MARNFCILILLCSIANAMEQFSFSAKVVSSSHVVFYDELNISPLMVHRKVGKPLCKLKEKKPLHVKIIDFLKEYQDEILDCFINNKIIIYDTEEHKNNQAYTQTFLIIPPVRFAVEFKDDFATLRAIIP